MRPPMRYNMNMVKRGLTILAAVPVIFLCTYFGGLPFQDALAELSAFSSIWPGT